MIKKITDFKQPYRMEVEDYGPIMEVSIHNGDEQVCSVVAMSPAHNVITLELATGLLEHANKMVKFLNMGRFEGSLKEGQVGGKEGSELTLEQAIELREAGIKLKGSTPEEKWLNEQQKKGRLNQLRLLLQKELKKSDRELELTLTDLFGKLLKVEDFENDYSRPAVPAKKPKRKQAKKASKKLKLKGNGVPTARSTARYANPISGMSVTKR